MYLDKAKKEEIFSKYGKSNSDTGSAESQIALFSSRPSVFVSNQLRQTHCLTEQNPIVRKSGGIFLA